MELTKYGIQKSSKIKSTIVIVLLITLFIFQGISYYKLNEQLKEEKIKTCNMEETIERDFLFIDTFMVQVVNRITNLEEQPNNRYYRPVTQ